MFKKLAVIGVIGLCLFGLTATDALAACTVRYGILCCSDLCPFASGTGAGNVDVNTVAVCSSLAITNVDADQCWNPAWNSGEQAQGIPYGGIIFDSAVTQLTSANLVGERGNWAVNFVDYGLCYSWDTIWGAITAAVCPNSNWNLVRAKDDDLCIQDGIPDNFKSDYCKPLIREMYAYFATYQEKKGILVHTSDYCARCTFDPGANMCLLEGNPISCVQTALSDCTSKGLNVSCDDAVLQ